jgi:glycerol-1-phosphate dehydrogenase [NAD(P)+]
MAHRENSDVPSLVMQPFCIAEEQLADVLANHCSYTAVVNDPPWTRLAPDLQKPQCVVFAGDMSLTALEAATAIKNHGETIVGIGGGTAMDTAKFIAWKLGRRLIQLPTITSVDAAFTDAIGVRVERKVRYLSRIEPKLVVLDVPRIRSAPRHLNPARIGDAFSCHTSLYDWWLASQYG